MNNVAEQIPLDLRTRPALGRDDFLIAPENRDAVSWIDQWPNWPAPFLVISGPVASGKTHLAAVWRNRTDASVINPEDLLTKTARVIADTGQNVILDNLDLWLGDLKAETTLFHLYNIFKEEQKTCLVTMHMPPSRVTFALPDLASRFRAAPTAEIRTPGDELLQAVLLKLFSDRQLQVSHDVIQYILPRMDRSFSAARAIVERADKIALSRKKGISIPLLREVLLSMQEDLV